MLNIVLFGPPGAGKGTQSEKLIAKYQLVHLSTGDIFRANIKGETKLGRLAKSYMDSGQLVPDEVTISMLESEVNKYPSAKGFIFDGFPRTHAQAEALDDLLKSKGTSITLMLALEVEETELKKRLWLRGQDSGRPDDRNPDVIQKRIDVYNSETAPVKDFYMAQGKYEGVQGIGEIDTIFNALCSVINSKLDPVVANVAKATVISKKEKTPTKKIASTTKKIAKKVAKNKVVKVAKKVKPAPKKKTVKKVAKKAVKKVVKKVVKKAVKKKVQKAVKKQLVKATKKKVVKKSLSKKVLKKGVKKNLKFKSQKVKTKKPVKQNSKVKSKKSKARK